MAQNYTEGSGAGVVVLDSARKFSVGNVSAQTFSGRLNNTGGAAGAHGQPAGFPKRVVSFSFWAEGESGELVQIAGIGTRIDEVDVYLNAPFPGKRIRGEIVYSDVNQPGAW
jgi:hypothetical protein